MAKEPTHVAAEDAPDDVRPPEQGPPAIGGGLRHAVQHHRSRHVHHQPQDAHQDHAAGHADDAGQEGGGQHREVSKVEGERGQHRPPGDAACDVPDPPVPQHCHRGHATIRRRGLALMRSAGLVSHAPS